MAARHQASARYREKCVYEDIPTCSAHSGRRNLEEEREKARARMARHWARVLTQADRGEDFRARAREASRKHRENRNGPALAHRQRVICMEEYGRKHGPRAWLVRQNLLEERRAEAQEREDFHRRQKELDRILEPISTKILAKKTCLTPPKIREAKQATGLPER
ncbi:hypothetical protein K438DRAFT_1775795 [Mycena galopus ATCC 62051]|nr:hypothetical protein K438DRAFT_1775795 [Mycena galopus ATCC 62051]